MKSVSKTSRRTARRCAGSVVAFCSRRFYKGWLIGPRQYITACFDCVLCITTSVVLAKTRIFTPSQINDSAPRWTCELLRQGLVITSTLPLFFFFNIASAAAYWSVRWEQKKKRKEGEKGGVRVC